MFEVKIRKLERRGMAHEQRCEDDSLAFSYNQIAVLIVFDGCSSGTDSYFASALFAKIFKKIAIEGKGYFESLNENSHLETIAYTIIHWFFEELKYVVNYLELDISEVLSTIVFSLVNIKTKKSYSVIFGDGSIYVNGETFSVHAENNAPNYIAGHLNEQFYDVWENNCAFKRNFDVKETIAVLSDGIDSFRSYREGRYVNDIEKEDILYRFFRSGRFLDSKIGLAKICNILDSEKHIAPSDDLSIAHITFVEKSEKNEAV